MVQRKNQKKLSKEFFGKGTELSKELRLYNLVNK